MSNASVAAPPAPVDLFSWINSVRSDLRPPVGNKLLFGAGQHKVMVVGGPNARRDFHIERGEELFLQLEGDMVLEVVERGRHRAVPIRAGEVFLLPGDTPHSPQRAADTVGLVLERARLPGEVDALRWYTPDGSGRLLYEEAFACTDLGTQLRPVIERFNASEACRSGEPTAGAPESATHEGVRVNADRDLGAPVALREWAAAQRGGSAPASVVLFGAGASEAAHADFDYSVAVKLAPDAEWEREWQWARGGGELFLFQFSGSGELDVLDVRSGSVTSHYLRAGHVLLLPAGGLYKAKARWQPGDCICLVITNCKAATE